MHVVGTNGMGSNFGLCNSRLKQRFVTERVHLKFSTHENSFDLEPCEEGEGQNFRYLRAVDGEYQLHIHVTGMYLCLCLRISVNFFSAGFCLFRAVLEISLQGYYTMNMERMVTCGK
jgi:hypothetical protein